LNLSLDLLIRDLDSVALDEAVATDGHELLIALHAIVIVEDLHDGVLRAVVLLGERHFTEQVACSVLAYLDCAVVEANRDAHLVAHCEVHASDGGDPRA